ncbi:MAG: ABC-three component system protein, partial [Myxococcota bacterium]
MIREISASDGRFNGATFRSGFNLVLGASTKDSTDRDSTNGVGKSSMVELIHFALASEPGPGEFPREPALAGWEFRYKLELDGRLIDVARAVDSFGWVVISNPDPAWGRAREDGTVRLRRSKWSDILRQSCFNSNVNTAAAPPSFRQLIRHFVRYKDGDFLSAFGFLQGKKWQSRRVSAFILGLDWELQALVGELEEKNEIAKSLRTKTGQSVLHGSGFDRAGLEAEASRLSAEADVLQRQLDSFRVHEQYAELEREADQLTARLAAISDENVLDEERIRLLGDAVSEVAEGETSDDVRSIYAEAGLLFPEAVLSHLDSLTRFHRNLIRNRRDFLTEELQRKSAVLVRRREEMKTLDERRGEVMRVLRSHGALDQFQQLHSKLGRLLGRLEEARAALERTEHLATLRAEYKAEVAKLERRAAREHESRRGRREYVQRIYSLLVKEMY